MSSVAYFQTNFALEMRAIRTGPKQLFWSVLFGGQFPLPSQAIAFVITQCGNIDGIPGEKIRVIAHDTGRVATTCWCRRPPLRT